MSNKRIAMNILIVQGTSWEFPSKPWTKEMWDKFPTDTRRRKTIANIPIELDTVQLKGYLRDLGFISSQSDAYSSSRILFAKDFGEEFSVISGASVNTTDIKTLEELEAKDGSILIVLAAKEPSYSRHDSWGGMRCLYGCPMANSVKQDICEAESYKTEDSISSTLKIEN